MDTSDPNFLVMAGATCLCGLLMVVFVYKTFVAPSGPPTVLPVDDFAPIPLIRKEKLSHDTCRFTFGLKEGHALGLPTGQHISLKFTSPEGKVVQRSYTPVTDNTSIGEVALVVKVYRPLPPKFPNGGLMSQHLDSLKIGDTILMKGPKGHLTWKANGNFTVKPLGKPLEVRKCTTLGMMAGGTGITPMLQVLHEIVKTSPNLKVKLIYANQTPDDILVRQELEDLQKNYPTRFSLWYTVDRVKEGEETDKWTYDTGFITTKMIQDHLLFDKDSGKTQQFFMCGPPPMIKFACLPALKECGYSEKNWVIF